MGSTTSTAAGSSTAISQAIINDLPAATGYGQQGSTNPWLYAATGVSPIIYPDFQPSGQPGQIYYPSYQLANLYAAYDVDPQSGSTSQIALSGGTDPINVDTGLGYVEINQNDGFWQQLPLIYGGMTYALTSKDQQQLASVQQTVASQMLNLYNNVYSNYSNNTVFSSSASIFFPAGTQTSDSTNLGGTILPGLQESLTALANTITVYGDQIIQSTSELYNQWQSATQGLTTQQIGQELSDSGSSVNQFANALASTLVQGELENWNDTFLQDWGPLSPVTFTPEFTLPWNSNYYSEYVGYLTDSASTEYYELTNQQQQGQSPLLWASEYLSNLTTYNQNAALTTLSTPLAGYLSTVPGVAGSIAYSPLWSTTPLGGSGSTSSITMTLDSTTSDGSQVSVDQTTLATADAYGGGFDGWFFGGFTANSSFTQTTWNSYDDTATNLNGTFAWNDIEAISITPDQQWLLASAMSDAWNSVPANNSNFNTSGYAFSTADEALGFITTNFYNISGVAYGTPSSTITGQTNNTQNYSNTYFNQSDTVNAGAAEVGWGFFGGGVDATYSSSTTTNSSTWDLSSNTTGFTVVNNPLGTTPPSSAATGTASAPLGVTLQAIALSNVTIIDDINASSSLSNALGGAEGDKKKVDTRYASLGATTTATVERLTAVIELGDKSDVHYGSDQYKDRVTGGNGSDSLYGFGGNDLLIGGNGTDHISGGTGSNRLSGGKGADAFELSMDDILKNKKYHQTILDFAPGSDRLWLTGGLTPDKLSARGNNVYFNDQRLATLQGLSDEQTIDAVRSADFVF